MRQAPLPLCHPYQPYTQTHTSFRTNSPSLAVWRTTSKGKKSSRGVSCKYLQSSRVFHPTPMREHMHVCVLVVAVNPSFVDENTHSRPVKRAFKRARTQVIPTYTVTMKCQVTDSAVYFFPFQWIFILFTYYKIYTAAAAPPPPPPSLYVLLLSLYCCAAAASLWHLGARTAWTGAGCV